MTKRRIRPGARLVRLAWRPGLTILLVAPFFGETLSAATAPLQLLVPWNLALMAGLYGSGALLCREVARRFRLGLLGLCLLGAAYGVYEEALLDRYWFYPRFWHDTGIGSYGRFWHTNVLLAVHLTVFHTAVSIGSSVLIVERLFPVRRARAWAGRRELVFAGLMLAVVVPFCYGEPPAHPGVLVLLAAGLLGVVLVIGAFLAPRLRGRPVRAPRRRRWPGVGLVAFCCTAAHFAIVYTLPSTSIPWPVGIGAALAPIPAAIFVIGRVAAGGFYGADGLRVVTGILAFFVLLDVTIGLAGQYDLVASALATALALWRLRARDHDLAGEVTPVTAQK